MDNAELTATVNKLKERIIKIEAGSNDLSETDTRQGLINPLFRSLGWDFSDFDSIKSEVRILKVQRARRLRLLQLEEEIRQADLTPRSEETRAQSWT